MEFKSIPADYILKGDALFDANTKSTFQGFVAVKGNKIIGVGGPEKMDIFVGDNTEVMDCSGKLISASFHDSHFHVSEAVLSNTGIDLANAKSEEEAAQMVADFAKTLPDDGTPVTGFTWYHGNWDRKELPTKESLDRLIPNRAVILYRTECHGIWLNSKGLELYGIDRDTVPPTGGEIMKDKNGEPTGYIHEYAIFLGKGRVIFPDEIDKKRYKDVFDMLTRFGVTSISDLDYDVTTNFDVIEKMIENDEVSIRYGFSTLEQYGVDLERAEQFKKKYNSEKMKFLGFKMYIDGTALGYTAELLEPYTDKPDTCNDNPLDFDLMRENILKADKAGYRYRLHTIGDGAVRFALDTFEECQKVNGTRDSRHSTAHMEASHPDDTPRYAQLGVILDMHPGHVTLPCEKAEDNPYLVHLGERGKYCFNYKSVIDTGGKYAIGSDYPVITPNPIFSIHSAVNRTFVDGKPKEGWNPEQRLSVGEALYGYTLGTAFHDFKEQTSGSLETGKFADIVVIDRNLFAIPKEQIINAEVEMTMFDGKIVYKK